MASTVEESATQLFSKFINVSDSFNFDKDLFPNLRFKDVIEVYGESGSGKTELLYHFIVQCLLPRKWKDLNLHGTEMRVVLIDNDCRFNLFRLTTIFETRLKALQQLSPEEITLLVSERIQFVEVAQCYDTQQFLITLYSLEHLLALSDMPSVVMIDGLTSFYWCDRMKGHQKLHTIYSKVCSVLKNISQNGKIPILATRRRIMKALNSDKNILGKSWKNIVTWQIELTLKDSKPDGTIVSLCNITSNIIYHCMIGKFGFVIMYQKEKYE